MKELENDIHIFADYPAHVFNWAVGPEGISLKEGREIFKGAYCLGRILKMGKRVSSIEAVRKKSKLKPND